MQFASFLGTVFIICSWENNGSLNHDGDLDTDRLVWSFSDVHFIVEDILQVINLKNQLDIYEKNYTYLLWLGFGLAWMIIAKLFCTYLTMYVCWSILGLHSKTTVSKCLLSFFQHSIQYWVLVLEINLWNKPTTLQRMKCWNIGGSCTTPFPLAISICNSDMGCSSHLQLILYEYFEAFWKRNSRIEASPEQLIFFKGLKKCLCFQII